MSAANHFRWTSGQPHLLTPESLALVRNALNEGVVFGLKSFYCAARGPDVIAFADFESYVSTVEQSRPGDWFTLWLVPAALLAGAGLFESRSAEFPPSELERLRKWLSENPMHEFIAVGRAEPGAPPRIEWGDIDSFNDLESLAVECGPMGEVSVFNLALLDSDTARPATALINAKRPNEQGEVPLGGAY